MYNFAALIMANDFFRFKRFIIYQGRCAMKVGTDGTLLGAWARGGKQILDIGTGTGLIALMMAQRFPNAQISGVEIDEQAFGQALENVAASPFADRIAVIHQDFCQGIGGQQFDAIVSNPPFFDQALESPDVQRTAARHTSSLSYRELMTGAYNLLSEDGHFSVVIPADHRLKLETEAYLAGFFISRVCAVKTSLRKPVKRYLLEFCKKAVGLQREEIVIGSELYQELVNEFYL